MAPTRSRPNILVTGTPGTGKTTTADLIASSLNLTHVSVSDLVKERNLHQGYDEEFDTYILDEDKVCDELDSMIAAGGYVVDFHSCDFFPKRYFDLILVLRTDNTILYDRLEKRGYRENKISENIECEIMQVVLEEAKEAYDEEIVVELCSNTVEEMEENVGRVKTWYDQWMQNNQS